METRTETGRQDFLAQFNFKRGRKNPQYFTVRVYPARSEEHSGKPYAVKDLQGREFKLQARERIEVERRVLGTADARDLFKQSQRRRIITAKQKVS